MVESPIARYRKGGTQSLEEVNEEGEEARDSKDGVNEFLSEEANTIPNSVSAVISPVQQNPLS